MSSRAVMTFLRALLRFWKTLVVLLVPLVAMPVAFQGNQDGTHEAYKCAYVMIIMAAFWVTEALPLAITALIPVVLFPILGIMTTDEVGKEYLKETNLMFMSGIMVALAVEHCNLHTRIALRVLLAVGTGLRSLMFGFMATTAFFSMWISNTATTAMMVPIVAGVMNELESGVLPLQQEEKEKVEKEEMSSNEQQQQQQRTDEEGGQKTIGIHVDEKEDKEVARQKEEIRLRRVMMFLSVAYAANTGGTATLTGNGANLVLKGILSSSFEYTPVNYASWMGFALPMAIICVLICWLWLQFWFLGFSNPFRSCKKDKDENKDSKIKEEEKARKAGVKLLLKNKYKELGSMSFHESIVLVLFIALIFLWFFRDPGFLKGWGNYVTVERNEYKLMDSACTSNCSYYKATVEKETIDDATAGMLVVTVMFIIPSKLNFWPFNRKKIPKPRSSSSPGLLEWPIINKGMPWGLVLVLGGGFALAKATEVSGFSKLLSQKLEVLDFLDQRVLLLIVMVFTAAATEVTSNVAVISILLPILRDLSLSLHINPLYLMVPSTIACCYAFMLPVATPPNAIVYSASGVMKTTDMIKCGFFVNCFCLIINYLCINTYGMEMFDLDTFPDWTNSTTT